MPPARAMLKSILRSTLRKWILDFHDDMFDSSLLRGEVRFQNVDLNVKRLHQEFDIPDVLEFRRVLCTSVAIKVCFRETATGAWCLTLVCRTRGQIPWVVWNNAKKLLHESICVTVDTVKIELEVRAEGAAVKPRRPSEPSAPGAAAPKRCVCARAL